VEFELVVRQYYANGILRAADWAAGQGLKEMTAIEFGVAAGTGLLNAAMIARRVEKTTGVRVRIVGFDSGAGMPVPADYRDHPDLYSPGDFPMDVPRLRQHLPPGVDLVLGEVSQTVPDYLGKMTAPLGFVAFDLDYYSSTKQAMTILDGKPESYLPIVFCYFDDVYHEAHNSWCGELLAINEFNASSPMRKFERFALLENRRIFTRAAWLKQMYQLHVLDHPSREKTAPRVPFELPKAYF
jgi:hypothetical protein